MTGFEVIMKFSVCLKKNHAIKTYGEVKIQLHAFLPSALDGGVVCFTPRSFNPPPKGKSPQQPLDRRIGGPQSPFGHSGGEKALPGIESRSSSP
jgi:hypothetical protein